MGMLKIMIYSKSDILTLNDVYSILFVRKSGSIYNMSKINIFMQKVYLHMIKPCIYIKILVIGSLVWDYM